MSDYKKLDPTHHLSSFQVRLPIWDGSENPRSPFAEWKSGNSLPWYKAYNDVKHSRHVNFDQSNFRNMLDSMCGLVALLGSQFFTIDIGPEAYVSDMSSLPGYEIAIGNYFEISGHSSTQPDIESVHADVAEVPQAEFAAIRRCSTVALKNRKLDCYCHSSRSGLRLGSADLRACNQPEH
jgi:hypothetical protein